MRRTFGENELKSKSFYQDRRWVCCFGRYASTFASARLREQITSGRDRAAGNDMARSAMPRRRRRRAVNGPRLASSSALADLPQRQLLVHSHQAHQSSSDMVPASARPVSAGHCSKPGRSVFDVVGLTGAKVIHGIQTSSCRGCRCKRFISRVSGSRAFLAQHRRGRRPVLRGSRVALAH